MGIYDRDWIRGGPPRAAARPRTAVVGLIIANVVCYLVQILVFRDRGGLVGDLGLRPSDVLGKFSVWQLVTCLFLHDPTSPFHLLFNMYVLWMFGPKVEESFGRRRFIGFYFVCGVAASVAYVLLGPFTGLSDVAVGASGAILGVLVYHTLLDPDAPVLLLFFLPMKMKWATVLFIGVDVVAFTTGSLTSIAHTAHLGGALAGLLWFVVERRKRRPRRASKPPSPPPDDPAITAGVDRLLDKIREEGIASLSEEEKRFLRDASRRLRDRR